MTLIELRISLTMMTSLVTGEITSVIIIIYIICV